uniref:Protein-tyrosine-phosphatase n=1 Tax=Strongyloides stercoralis TaxID=6248 RepID=A0A913HNX3_STRER
MFLHFKYLTIVWLLLQFLEYSDQNSHGHLFPSFPKNISGSSLTLTYKYKGLSDFIYAKCPNSKYKHTKIADRFTVDKELYERNFLIPSDNEVFVWIPMTYNHSGPNSIYCGILQLKNINSTIPSFYEWFFNLNWEKKPDPIQLASPEMMSTQIPRMKNKCGASKNRTLIYFKDKKNGLKKLNSKDKIIAHVNDLYYYFQIPDNDEKMEMKEPCAIAKAVNEKPEIIVKGYNASSISFNNLEIYVIKQKIVSGTYSIKLYMENEMKVPDFYEGEKVKMQKMKFTRSGIEELPNSGDIITSTFSMEGFQLIKFSYDCPTQKGPEMIEKIFYFGPESENYIFPNQFTVYFQNETAVQPNCSIHRINFGYLDSITVDEATIKLDELKDGEEEKNNFKRVKDFVFLLNTKKSNITLHCLYVTPNGKVTLVQTFLKGVDVVVGYDDNGKEIKEVKLKNEKSDELEKKIAEKDKIIAAKDKPSFEKLKDKMGTFGAYSVIIVPVLFVLTCTIIIAILCYLKFLKPWLEKKRIQDKHPNIFTFWNEMSNQNLETYSETIQNEKYIPDKLKNQKVSKKIEGGEEVEFNPYSCFDNSLVKCYKGIKGEIKAHYISDVSPVRTYIISDGPPPEKEGYFWELLYREDVGVVVAIIYQQQEVVKNTSKKMFYWPEKKQNYGKVTVEFKENIQSDIPFVGIKIFSMTMANGESKRLVLFHVSNWKEHEIPRSDLHLVKLYKKVSEFSETGKVLVHTSYGSASRVFMYTYFSCIFEAMKEDDSIDDPLEIIKKVREQRYGGNISSMEYAYIIKALVTYFFECKILIDVTNHRITFSEEYDNYMLKFDAHEFNMDPNLKNFLTFVNVIDDGKLKNICDQSINLQMLKSEDIELKCRRFNAVAEVEKDKKIRYDNIPCLDKTSLNIRGKGSNDLGGFIHANEFVYKYGEGKERKIIMCQGPLKETIDDMFDMIHRYKVGIVVALVNENEMGKGDKYFGYLYTGKTPNNFGTYTLMYNGHKNDPNKFFIEYNYSVINNTSKIVHNFKVLHYINWPDRSIPVEKQSLYGLYKRIIELYDNHHIAIHCSAGIGRTGTLALIIYMIDIINSKKSFDPIKCLAKIRQHRYKAVQTTSQFVFALSILYEHYKEQIDNMDKQAYKYFMTLAQNFYNQNIRRVGKKEA